MKSLIPGNKTALTPGQFEKLADVPPEIEWLANITNEKTRRAYQNDVSKFSHFLGYEYLKSSKPSHDRM